MILKRVFHWILNYWHRLVSLSNVPVHCNREAVGKFVCVHVCISFMHVSEYICVCVVCMNGYRSLLIIVCSSKWHECTRIASLIHGIESGILPVGLVHRERLARCATTLIPSL